MLFQTTAAHEELRAKIRSFAEEEIKPLAFLMDQNNEFPEEAVKKLGKLGWMGIPYPKEYGLLRTAFLLLFPFPYTVNQKLQTPALRFHNSCDPGRCRHVFYSGKRH